MTVYNDVTPNGFEYLTETMKGTCKRDGDACLPIKLN